ncbi:hypothetical protein KOI35_19395 [Actinoplanes bogorensis]|uniref:Cell division protein FtsL n=1 Tax=Paractinoplanes bogorensis TaxID=1610840 RepID=A0ABS5YQG1_9ACTN|nr:hypothetical protein [Actinoplanes bogorensis]MBU2665677.1 hypothetical protein [Actinoplanes bogorensis]
MSERTQAPRSGGRTADQYRPTTGRRDTGRSRDADAPGSAGRGARQFAGAKERDTRRSGGRSEPVRDKARGRGRVDAPVDGAAALQIDVTVEPLRVTEQGAKPRLRVAPPPPIHGGPRAPFVAGVIGVVIVGVLGILLINTKTNENSFRIAELQNQNSALDNQRQDLDNQLVEASSIGNLDAAARRLGLVRANIQDVAQLRLPDGKIIRVPRPAEGPRSITAPDTQAPSAGTGPTGTAPAGTGR